MAAICAGMLCTSLEFNYGTANAIQAISVSAKSDIRFTETTTAVAKGEKAQFSINSSEVDWSVSDTLKADINKNGKLTAKKTGWVTVRAKIKDNGKTVKQKILIVNKEGTVSNQKQLNAVLFAPKVTKITIKTEKNRKFLIEGNYPEKKLLVVDAPESEVDILNRENIQEIYEIRGKVNDGNEEEWVGPGALDETYNVKELIEIADNVALEFVNNMGLQDNIMISETIPVYDETEGLTGCCVSFEKQGEDYGYAVVTVSNGNMFVEQFSLGEGTNSLYNAINETNVYTIDASEEKVLYRNGDLSYYTIFKKENGDFMALDNYGESWKVEEKSNAYTAYDKFNETVVHTIPSSYIRLDTELSIPGVCYKQDDIINMTGKYACAVAALTEICDIKGVLKNGSIATTFNLLWDYTKTAEIEEPGLDTSNSTIYGSTSQANIASGMSKYLALQGKSCTTYTYENAAYADIRTILSAQLPSTYTYSVYVKDESGEQKRKSYTVSTLGCFSVKDNHNTYQYIKIANGWRNQTCYICINQISKFSPTAVAFRIS